MSLINDALKRARQAQPAPAPTAPDPRLQPVDSAQAQGPSRRGRPLLAAAFVMSATVALVLAWQLLTSHAPSTVYARPTTPAPAKEPAAAAPLPATAPALVAPAPVAPPAMPNAPTPNPPVPASASAPIPAPPTQATAVPVEVSTPAPPPPVATPAAPPALSLRLQSIISDPARPSALINGQAVFLGERVGELRVVAITRDSATLVGAGCTNVLHLGQ